MMNSDNFNSKVFGEDFQWGVSTAAFQVEGACDTGGRGESVWDVFTRKKGKIFGGHHAGIACDFYNKYASDIQIIKALGIPNFRFSVSWSRIMPNGTGAVNQEGVDFYNRVIDYCLLEGITPWITLYHWDLPQALERRGGWTNREVVSWFATYVKVCANQFGDRVKHWMVMNEPMVFTAAGYFLGIHAPGKRGMGNFLKAVHYAALSNAEGGRVLRTVLPRAEIGTTISCSYIEPFTASLKDTQAAVRVDAILNRLFIEPLLGIGYPVDDVPALRRMAKVMQPGDHERLQFDFDFIGIQNYTREIVRHSWYTPYTSARLVEAKNRNVPVTTMGTEVYPDGIYHLLKKYDDYPGIRKMIVTENGAAFPDVVTGGEVHDVQRTKFLQKYLAAILRAKQEGCKVDGYFVWTLTDNFEWAEGYKQRFGLIYVDFDTQVRTVKDSGKWYSAFINGGHLAKPVPP